MSNARMSYTDRYQHLTEQTAYRRSIAARGLRALLAPYGIRMPLVPQQRTKSADTLPSVGVSG